MDVVFMEQISNYIDIKPQGVIAYPVQNSKWIN